MAFLKIGMRLSWILVGVLGVLCGYVVANPGYYFSSGPKYSPGYSKFVI